MSDFKPGDRINVTVEGARVQKEDARWLDCQLGAYHFSVPLDREGVTVERATPAEWPPQPEDLWKHPRGALLFAMEQGSNVVLTNSSGRVFSPDETWEMRHELTLVHREGSTS